MYDYVDYVDCRLIFMVEMNGMKTKSNPVISAGIPSPEINLSNAAGGGISVAWDSSHFPDKFFTSEQMLGFVVQWQCTPHQMQWKRIEKNYNSVNIQGKINPPKPAHIPSSIMKCILTDPISCMYRY